MPITDLGVAAIITAVSAAIFGYLRLRQTRKLDAATTPSEAYSTRAHGDKTYAQLAEDAWDWVDYLRRRDYMHERRFDLIEPILEKCAEGDPKFLADIEAAKKLGEHLRAARAARIKLENGKNGGTT